MEIRLAVLADVAVLSGMYEAFFAHNAAQQPVYYRCAAEPGSYPEATIKNGQEDILIAVEKDKIMGFTHIAEGKTPPYACFVPHKYAVIVDLYVQEAHRQRGVGTRLLEAAKQWAQARGLDYLELNVLAENEKGIQFYRHQKFNMVSQIMRLPLNDRQAP